MCGSVRVTTFQVFWCTIAYDKPLVVFHQATHTYGFSSRHREHTGPHDYSFRFNDRRQTLTMLSTWCATRQQPHIQTHDTDVPHEPRIPRSQCSISYHALNTRVRARAGTLPEAQRRSRGCWRTAWARRHQSLAPQARPGSQTQPLHSTTPPQLFIRVSPTQG